MISYIIPTRDRPQRLAQTLGMLQRAYAEDASLARAAEIIVVDNASTDPVKAPQRTPGSVKVRVVRLEQNRNIGARNIGAAEAKFPWVVMLDDDSYLTGAEVHRITAAAPADVAAIGAEILLADGTHEAGGLPEVFIGCGVAIRRDVFNTLGGYDESFGYYAEEYDLSARILNAGLRVAHHGGWSVIHHKVAHGRDMDRICGNLVRNNAWVLARYAPDGSRTVLLAENSDRYRQIAENEGALAGYARGIAEVEATIASQPRAAMRPEVFDRFTGLAAARAMASSLRARTATVIATGKNRWAVEQALTERNIAILPESDRADVRIIGTLSPGPALDAFARASATPGPPVIAPYLMPGARPAARAHAA